MKGHVVRRPVFVRVSDVMDCTDCHGNLAKRIDNGQVDDGPEGGRLEDMVVMNDVQ